MNRRAAAGVGIAAASAGFAWAWLRMARDDVPDDGFWQLRFEQPSGGELVLAQFRGRPLVLNFWATWCAPCIREMPALDEFQRRYRPQGWQVLGLAVDSPAPVREFLVRRPVSFSIGLAGFDGAALSRKLGNPQGQLPFTAVFDASGKVRHRKLGETKLEEMVRWADAP